VKNKLRRSVRRAYIHDLFARNVITKPQEKAKITAVSRELKEATCRSCRTQLGLDGTSDYRPCLLYRSRWACAQ
jgi:hypothetical protein